MVTRLKGADKYFGQEFPRRRAQARPIEALWNVTLAPHPVKDRENCTILNIGLLWETHTLRTQIASLSLRLLETLFVYLPDFIKISNWWWGREHGPPGPPTITARTRLSESVSVTGPSAQCRLPQCHLVSEWVPGSGSVPVMSWVLGGALSSHRLRQLGTLVQTGACRQAALQLCPPRLANVCETQLLVRVSVWQGDLIALFYLVWGCVSIWIISKLLNCVINVWTNIKAHWFRNHHDFIFLHLRIRCWIHCILAETENVAENI